MELFYAAKKRAEDAGDSKALEWFNEAEEMGGNYFHIVDGKNTGDGTALHQAVKDEALEAALRLLEVDADVHAVGGIWRGTPLHLAAGYSHAELIPVLLEAKSDAWAPDTEGNTPVHVARRYHGARRHPLVFRDAELTRLVEMEGGSRSDAQVLKPVVL